jgi:hypothetical protein
VLSSFLSTIPSLIASVVFILMKFPIQQIISIRQVKELLKNNQPRSMCNSDVPFGQSINIKFFHLINSQLATLRQSNLILFYHNLKHSRMKSLVSGELPKIMVESPVTTVQNIYPLFLMSIIRFSFVYFFWAEITLMFPKSSKTDSICL